MGKMDIVTNRIFRGVCKWFVGIIGPNTSIIYFIKIINIGLNIAKNS
jgi:hypothetical protein